MEAFALRAEHKGTVKSLDDDGNEVEVPRFRGGSFSLKDGSTFDLAEHFGEDGEGVVRTVDPDLIAAFEMHGAFKRVGEADAADAGAPVVNPLTEMTATALRALPEANQVEGASRMRKEELATRIELVRNGGDPNVALEERDGALVPVAANDDQAGDGQEG